MSLTKRIFSIVLFLVAIAVLVTLITSCSPLAQAQPGPTATAKPTPTILSTKPANTPSAIPQTCTVTTGIPRGNLNLRINAGTQYGVIRVLREGENLQVIARGAWLQVVDSQGARGYVNSRYCEVQP